MEKKNIKKISYRLQFIDSATLMAGSLSNLVINLAEGFDEIKGKYKHDGKKHETCGIQYKHYNYSLKYTSVIDDLIE